MNEDWVSEEWGDRRQELVFIGSNLDEGPDLVQNFFAPVLYTQGIR